MSHRISIRSQAEADMAAAAEWYTPHGDKMRFDLCRGDSTALSCFALVATEIKGGQSR